MARLLTLMALPILALGGDLTLPATTYSGKLPTGIDGGFAARLDSNKSQYLMSSRGGMLVAFAFEHGIFTPRCSLPLPAPIAAPNGGSPLATGSVVTAGDVDGDGLDELVVGGTRTLRKYEKMGDAFALTAMASVYPDSGSPSPWTSDVCVGDVDKDGTNEVLIAGVDSLTSYATGDYRGRTTLYLCRWTGDKLTQTWNDRGALKLEGPSWVMPIAEMRCVCDPMNRGRPLLLVKEGASDVSAGMYRELEWTAGELVGEGYFVIRDGRIERNLADDDPQNSAIGCDFARVGGRTAVLASVLKEGDTWLWQGEYLVFDGDSAVEHVVLWSAGGPSSGIVVDLDGRGPGFLRFGYPRREGGAGFEFYRL